MNVKYVLLNFDMFYNYRVEKIRDRGSSLIRSEEAMFKELTRHFQEFISE